VTPERPRLKQRLRFTRHDNDGAVSWIVKDPASLKYFRFGQIECWIMQRLDGERSLQQICDELHTEIGMNATPQALDVLVRRLRELGLVERTAEERRALLVEQMRRQRKTRRNTKGSLLRMRFSVGDPDPLLGTMVERMPFFWTPGFIMASVGVFALYGLIVAHNWAAFVSGMAALYSPVHMTIGLFLICYGSFSIAAIIHEFGHGLTCKRHGGEVHEMGAMLLYFTPAFYCNVSDAWTFEKRSHRLWVTAAGGWIQMWVAAAGALLWLATEPGTLLNAIGIYTAVLSGGFSILFNYNPLIPLDGYYALVDVLNMPNLRARSFEYVQAVLKRRVLRLDTAVPQVTDRERRIFLTYGILALLYTTTILTTVALLVGRFIGARFGGWGLLLFALLLFRMTAGWRAAVVRTARLIAAGRRSPLRAHAGIAAGSLLVFALLLFAPWSVRVTGEALVEPEARYWLRPAQAGRLLELRVGEGGRAAAGDVLAVLRDPDLEILHAEALAQRAELATRAGVARAAGQAAAANLVQAELRAQQARIDLLQARRNALVLRAPVAGTVVTPRLEERLGELVAGGDSLIELWADGGVRTRITIAQRDAGLLRPGMPVRLRFPALPGLTVRTEVHEFETTAREHGVVIMADLPDGPGALLPGMSGRARVTVATTTAGGALARAVRRAVRNDLFL
jgi:putative peptide zinc metalloprotease protein